MGGYPDSPSENDDDASAADTTDTIDDDSDSDDSTDNPKFMRPVKVVSNEEVNFDMKKVTNTNVSI